MEKDHERAGRLKLLNDSKAVVYQENTASLGS